MGDELKRALKAWEKRILSPSQDTQPERKDQFETSSGLPLNRVYLPPETEEPYSRQLGFPGEYPYTRGIYPTMYRGRLWTMRQYAGYASAEETNRRFRYLLDMGQTGLSIAFDLPTQIGYDADDPRAEGEVGKVGVSISTLADMQDLFEGIPLDRISTSMTINAPAAILLAMYLVVAKQQGVDQQKLRGTIQNDILKEYVARGTYIFPPSPAMRLITDVFSYCAAEVPRWNTISISGYHMREAGCTAVQEVAFTLANAIAYVQAAQEAGLAVDDFAPQLTFFFNAHNDLIEEIAKFRSARRLWARIMREQFKARNSHAWRMRFHTQTAGSSLTAQQPENNVIRVALQALAAVLGGTQSLHTNSMDEALGLPTERAVSVALRTQQILALESGVGNTVDPLAGAYAIERLTDEIESQAQGYLRRIEEMGGAVRAVESGFMQHEIQEAAYRAQQALEREERKVVGVNAYASDEPLSLETLSVDPAVEHRQRQRLAAVRSQRDPEGVRERLSALIQAAESQDNLMPYLIRCVEAQATLGEISDALRSIWGEYRPAVVF